MNRPDSRVPVSLLTGFLGSGKTTLLSRLIRDPRMARTAVIINEFGEVGLDHLLIARADENTVLMDSGCVCCTIRTDLADTLRDLEQRRRSGRIPDFDRAVIETTGLADPAPLLYTLITEPFLSAHFRLEGVVTTVDALHGMNQLDRQEESVKQAAVADRLIITKTDLTAADQVAALRARLRTLNPGALLLDGREEAVSTVFQFDGGSYSIEAKSLDVGRWLQAEAYDAHANCQHADGHCSANDSEAPREKQQHRHDEAIESFCITQDQPVPWTALIAFLDSLTRLRGPDLLRVKGLLNVQESEQPIVIHGVQHLFHPPVQLGAWPTDDHRSRMVFITRNLRRAAVEELLQTCITAVTS
jgi:G3E family GTPase